MTRVRITRLGAGPAGVRRPGEVHEVSDDEALELIDAHAAEFVSPPRERAVAPGARENATLGAKAPKVEK